jgi:Arc/MetJ family transcription regulator
MRTTLDLPESLLAEAMAATHARTKTEVIKLGLQALIRQESQKELRDWFGKVDLDIDFDSLRGR